MRILLKRTSAQIFTNYQNNLLLSTNFVSPITHCMKFVIRKAKTAGDLSVVDSLLLKKEMKNPKFVHNFRG